jgi:serine/threonine-protein kinase
MPEGYDRLAAALADRYRIERELGAGGMATVYLAEDLKHNRKVAIKVLKPELAAVLGPERFVQEIKTTASLQHPHILPLHDSGEAHGFLYYVMPYIEGETLRDKLDRETQLGIEEAIKITTEVADALDYAHRNNVIHRDIKPENILLHDGRPMVADFGIALAVSAAAGGRMTETGLSLGTPHYMSPEQATAEKDLTNRSDIYSLGAVLYEMLTGDPPHTGSSAQQIIMKIVTEEAQPVTRTRKAVPPNVAAAVANALEKLPADRFASAAQFGEALANPAFTGRSATGPTVSVTGDGTRWKRIALGSAVAAFVAIAALLWSVRRDEQSSPTVKLSIVLPNGEQLADHRVRRFDLAPDGGRFVYVGPGEAGSTRLWVRDLAQLNARPLHGTEGACCPAFSPDGRAIAFIGQSPDPYVKVIDVEGGAPTTILSDVTFNEDIDWGEDGYIYLGSTSGRGLTGLAGSGVLVRVRADGSSQAWEQLTTLDSTRAEDQHFSPVLLPNGKGLLFTILYGSDVAPSVGVLDLATRKHQSLVPGSAARYLRSGHLVFADVDGSLMAAPFDQSGLDITGPPVALGGRITNPGQLGAREVSVADNGTMLFGADEPGTESLVWVDRRGEVEEIGSGWVANFETIALSPDGNRLAASTEEGGTQQLWIRNLAGGSVSKLTIEGRRNFRPFWSPSGDRLLFVSNRSATGKHELYARQIDGGVPEPVLQLEREIWEGEWSPDGQWLIYRTGVPPTRDLFVKHVHPDSVGRTISASDAFQEVMPTLSPDGRLLAYQSDETGRYEVYVRPFPNIDDDKRPVSTDGGTEPKWSRDGSELFYKNLNRYLVAAKVNTRRGFSIARRVVLFSVRDYQAGDEFCCHPTYDVSLDGERFLMIRRSGGKSELIFVQNVFRELETKIGR